MLSESEMEDDPNTHVTLSQKLSSRGNMEQGKSSIRLTELGPRLSLQLVKIEDGLMDGEVLYHDFIHKSEEEKAEIKKKRELKKKLKEKRKKIQEENKKLKEAKKQELKEKSLRGMQKISTETDSMIKKAADETNEEMKMEEDDDVEYYRKEVGIEPDKDLFSCKNMGGKRPPKTIYSYKNKKFKKEKHEDKKGRFSKDKKFKSGRDKTNAENRDHRPIGGSGFRKFSTSKKIKMKKK